MVCLCPPPPPLLTPHFYFPLELYVYTTLTNNYLAFFIYQWLLVNNHISKYNSFILVFYRRCINYVYVFPPPPTHTHFLAPSYATACAMKKAMNLVNCLRYFNHSPRVRASVHGAMGSSDRSLVIIPLSYFSFQPVLVGSIRAIFRYSRQCSTTGITKAVVCAIQWDCKYKRTLAGNRKNWSFTISLTPYNRK